MDKMTHEVRLAQWVEIIREANRSGTTKKEWCAQNGISMRKFYYWQKQVRSFVLEKSGRSVPVLPEQTLPTELPEQTPPVFVELPSFQMETSVREQEKPDEPSSFIPEIMVKYGQFQLLVGSGVKADTLSTVLSVIRHV